MTKQDNKKAQPFWLTNITTTGLAKAEPSVVWGTMERDSAFIKSWEGKPGTWINVFPLQFTNLKSTFLLVSLLSTCAVFKTKTRVYLKADRLAMTNLGTPKVGSFSRIHCNWQYCQLSLKGLWYNYEPPGWIRRLLPVRVEQGVRFS